MNVCLIIAGALCILYDAVLILLSPGTFLDMVITFTHIWFLAGAYLIESRQDIPSGASGRNG